METALSDLRSTPIIDLYKIVRDDKYFLIEYLYNFTKKN
jgi:hypothetical protein